LSFRGDGLAAALAVIDGLAELVVKFLPSVKRGEQHKHGGERALGAILSRVQDEGDAHAPGRDSGAEPLLDRGRHGLWESGVKAQVIIAYLECDTEIERLVEERFGPGEIVENRLDVVRMGAEGESHLFERGFVEGFGRRLGSFHALPSFA
jgi:hypothetical protein